MSYLENVWGIWDCTACNWPIKIALARFLAADGVMTCPNCGKGQMLKKSAWPLVADFVRHYNAGTLAAYTGLWFELGKGVS